MLSGETGTVDCWRSTLAAAKKLWKGSGVSAIVLGVIDSSHYYLGNAAVFSFEALFITPIRGGGLGGREGERERAACARTNTFSTS